MPLDPEIPRWLEAHGDSLEASFAFESWLSAGGDRKLVQPLLARWLGAHGESLEASFVFASWLSAGGSRELVEPFLTPWLEAHGESLEASFVIKSWLLAKGDRELVKPFLTPWLKAHGDKPEAEFVFRSWLSVRGDRDVIGPFVKAWLGAHGEKPEAQYFFSAWLSAGGKSATIQPFLIRWLSLHSEDPGASFVLKSWLNAEGDPTLVRPFVDSWLKVHGETRDAVFVLGPWLEAGGDFELVHQPALHWFRNHRDHLESSFLVSALGRQKELPLETVRDILGWCQRFIRNQQALWALTALGSHLLRPEIAREAAQLSRLVIERALGEAEVPLTARLLLIRLFSILAKSPELRSETAPLFLDWMRRTDLYSYDPNRLDAVKMVLHNRGQNPSILLYVKELIDAGALAVDRDRVFLRRLFAWVETWTPESRNKARRLLEGLTNGAGGTPEAADPIFTESPDLRDDRP
jgi:hypothetical protein